MKMKLVSLQERDRLIRKYQELKLRPQISSEKLFRPEHAKALEVDEHVLLKDIMETEKRDKELQLRRESELSPDQKFSLAEQART